MYVIDSHIHCGIQNVDQPFSDIRPLLNRARISGACLFAPVEDIYDRYRPGFDDNEFWKATRKRAHDYLLQIACQNRSIYPYYFVWNDFLIEDLDRGFSGIKWHHHSGEPPYQYENPRCGAMIDAICERGLPVVLEETFDRTIWFIQQAAGRTPVIIPHLGLLNGGFTRLLKSGVWKNETVYADTALAGSVEIQTFLDQYGAERLLFGSDYPFGYPDNQLQNLLRMGILQEDLKKICAENILRLVGKNAHDAD